MPLLVWITALCQEALAGPGEILRFTRFFRCRLPLRHRGGSPAGTGNGTGIGKFSPAFPARRRTVTAAAPGCSLRSEPRWAGGVAAGSAAHPCADDPALTSLSAPATPPAHRVFGARRSRRFVLDVGADSSATRYRRHRRCLHGFRARSPMRMGSYRKRQPTRVVAGLPDEAATIPAAPTDAEAPGSDRSARTPHRPAARSGAGAFLGSHAGARAGPRSHAEAWQD